MRVEVRISQAPKHAHIWRSGIYYAALKAEAPDKYLEQIKRSRSDAEWLSALKELRPDQYAQEAARREAEKQREQAKAAKRQAAADRARRENYPRRIQAALSEIRGTDPRSLSKDSAFSLFGS